jgi:uncharacterized protein YqjF (DUF2071 family)
VNIDRLSIRERPAGWSLMRQDWGKLLFMHWPIDEKFLRPLIPSSLTIDKFDGSAWIGMIPFTMWGIRASFLPPLPGTSAFHELNLRTYVHFKGVPGVWFHSLDAANKLAVWAARKFYHLPYFHAEMSLDQSGNTIHYASSRRDKHGAPGTLKTSWTVGPQLPTSLPESLAFFLTERYCLYSAEGDRLYRARIHHRPWPLQTATLNSLSSTMIESLGVPAPQDDPVLHYCEEISVDIWPLKKI